MSYNDITGDKIASKVVTDQYRDNYDQIFNKRIEMIKAVEETGKTTVHELIQQIQKMASEISKDTKNSDNLLVFKSMNLDEILDYQLKLKKIK